MYIAVRSCYRSFANASCQVLPPGFPGHKPYCPYTKNPGARWSAPDVAKAKRLVQESVDMADFDIARRYIPAPKANFAKVVVNGESWGVYVNAQQFNKEFLKEWFPDDADGPRWKVRGSPGGRE